jgi:UDP-glucose 4-epimerase
MSQLILVTGGAGFVGSNLCRRLVVDGHRVISLDNYFTGSKDNHVAGVEYREGHTKDIATLVPETPDIIFHLGEYSRVAKSLEEPETVFDLNVLGTFGVLEFWRAKKSKLVYAGSSTKKVGARADGVEGRDLAPYTWMKAANSELVANYARWYGLPYAIVYFYNVYGPGERAGVDQYGTVIETFRQQFLKNEPLTVRSPGSQKRNFTHVEDTVTALVLVGEKGVGDEYGISAQETHTLLEVAHMFSENIEMLPQTPTSRSEAGEVDITKVQALGWKQMHTLQDYVDSVKKTV